MSCAAPAPQILKETVQVEVTKEVQVVVKETVPVEVTKQVVVKETVPVEVIKEVTPVPTEGPEVVSYGRGETLYVAGAAWGPASTWNPFQPGSLANTTGTIGFVYEFLYAFDPRRTAILLLGGDKTGDQRWYEVNVPRADALYDKHVRTLEEEGLI